MDLNHDHTLDQKDPYLAGATISLYQGTTATGSPIATTTTNTSGAYLFDDADVASSYGNPGLNPGVYTIQETPPAGYANTGTQSLSQLNPVIGSTASTITVDVLNPTNMYIAFDVNQFFGRNAWDYLQQSLQYTNAGVTNGSPVVTMSNTNGLATGDTITVQQGSTTLSTTIAALSPNVSITLATNWTGTTGNAATVTNTETETAGQFPVQVVNPNQFTQTFSNAGVTKDGATVTMSNTSGFAVGQFVQVTDGTTTLYSRITKLTPNTSITLDDEWPGATGHTATVGVLSTFDPEFLTLCWDLANSINDSFSKPVSVTNVFAVDPTSGQGAPPNADRVAYLFNHYGAVDITNAAADAAALAGANATVPSLAEGTIAEAVGLQVAIWELEYGSAFVNLEVLSRLNNKNSGVTAQELSDINTWAAFYISDSVGKSETATFFVALDIVQLGQQGMVATGSYNFGNLGSPTITTTPSPTSVILSSTPPPVLTDAATVAGGIDPTGTITFTLFYNGGTTPVDTESIPVNGDGTYTTPTGYTLPTNVTVTGTYQWDASYTGDTNNSSTADLNDPAEQVTVSPASPSITTVPSTTSVTLGTTSVTLKDTAVLSGGYHETGTITFTLYYNGTTLVDTETVGVNGNGSYTTPTGYTLPTSGTVTGNYQWDASYSGDGNNNSTVDLGDSSERVNVSPASPSILTTPSTTSVTLGTSSVTLKDTAVLSGGYSPTGTITFTLYYNGGTTPVDTESVTVTGDGSYTTPTGYTLTTTGTVTGTYQWDATYTGDGNNNSSADLNDPSERVCVFPARPSIVTTPSTTSVALGTSSVTLKDSALLSGGYNPTGTITFTLYFNGGSTPVDTETDSVSGDGTYVTPTGYTLPTTGTVTGTYQWDATYTGDGNNNSTADLNDPSERVCVFPARPSIVTTPSPTSVALGTTAVTLKDTAVLSGGYHETGTITFTLYFDGTTLVDTETVVVNGNGSYSTPVGYTLPTMSSAAGTYQWDATYTGDGNNNSSADLNDPSESVVVTAGGPSIVTTPSATNVTLGTSTVTLLDSAVLSGGSIPTGTITFKLFYNGGTAPVDTETVGVNGDGTYTTPTGYTLPTSGTVTGTYQWDASYSGDSNNMSTSDCNDPNERVSVTPPQPLLISHATPSVTLGSAPTPITDSAVLSGGYFPTGTITFTVTGPGGFSYTQTDTVSGDGTYSASTTLPTNAAPGTYQWVATYSGDPNNDPARDQGGTLEQTLVVVPPPIVDFSIGGANCTTIESSTLTGNTLPGEMVDAIFTIPAGVTDPISLVVYTSTTRTTNCCTGMQIFDVASGTYGPGNYSLTVLLPNSYYQVDFITGSPLPTGGSYGARLLSSDNGGTQPPPAKPVSVGDFASLTFWGSTTGQSLIKCFNGSPTATNLAQWLVTQMPNLYGKNTGSHSLVNSNGSYFNNTQVAQVIAMGSFSGNDLSVLSVALSSYATSIDLAGSQAALKASQDGLKYSGTGTSFDTYNVGTYGAAFGVPNGTTLTVLQLMVYLNSMTTPGSPVSAGAGAVFSGIIAEGYNRTAP